MLISLGNLLSILNQLLYGEVNFRQFSDSKHIQAERFNRGVGKFLLTFFFDLIRWNYKVWNDFTFLRLSEMLKDCYEIGYKGAASPYSGNSMKLLN